MATLIRIGKYTFWTAIIGAWLAWFFQCLPVLLVSGAQNQLIGMALMALSVIVPIALLVGHLKGVKKEDIE